MPAVDIVDSTWIRGDATTLGAVIAQPGNWPRWWPGLELRPVELRGLKGVRWAVDRVSAGPARGLAGTAEVWLEPADDGVVAHFFLRLDPLSTRASQNTPAGRSRNARRIEEHYRALTKRAFWGVADRLNPHRLVRRTDVPPPSSPTAISGAKRGAR